MQQKVFMVMCQGSGEASTVAPGLFAIECRDTKEGLELQERRAAITTGLESACCSLAEQSPDLAEGSPIPAQRHRLLCRWAARRKLGFRGQNISDAKETFTKKFYFKL